MKKYFLNPVKKFGADPFCHFQEKCTFNSEKDITEPKARRLGYFNNQLKSGYQVKGQLQAFRNHGYRKPETDF